MRWLLQLDERLFLAVNGWGRPALDLVFILLTQLGRGLALAALVLGPMALLDRRRLRLHALPMVLSVALGALAVEGVKSAVGRERPPRRFAAERCVPARDGTRTCPRVRLPGATLLARSFPSGHAQAAVGAATWVALLYPALAVPAALLAALIALSRIYLGLHFPLDVLAGALVGVGFSLAGFLLARSWERRRGADGSAQGAHLGT